MNPSISPPLDVPTILFALFTLLFPWLLLRRTMSRDHDRQDDFYDVASKSTYDDFNDVFSGTFAL